MYQCDDCKKEMMTTNEFAYHLKDRIWIKANGKRKGCLCLKCIEGRLKRKLTESDFADRTDWIKIKRKGLL